MKKMSIFVAIVIFVAASAFSIKVAMAHHVFQPDEPGAPYTGYVRLHDSTSNHKASVGQYIRWSSQGRQDMMSVFPVELDMTADCAAPNYRSDQLNAEVAYTDMPNFGVDYKHDCGSRAAKEESELRLSPYYVVPERNYYHQVHFRKARSNVYTSGEINTTYESLGEIMSRYDHLAKLYYVYN